MTDIDDALVALRKGEFVLVYDSDKRENETDMVIAGEKIRPEDVARMRVDGGGLICSAIGEKAAEALDLPFMYDLLDRCDCDYKILKQMKPNDIKYDEKSSFSLTINHRKTFTGITDFDRALTISELGRFCESMDGRDTGTLQKEFGSLFRSPGHVHLLRSSGLDNREGHTELTTALMEMAYLSPVATICEMMDAKTHKALPKAEAQRYAEKNGFVFLGTNDIKEAYKKWRL